MPRIITGRDVVECFNCSIIIPDDDQVVIADSPGEVLPRFLDAVHVTGINPVLAEYLVFLHLEDVWVSEVSRRQRVRFVGDVRAHGLRLGVVPLRHTLR